MAFAKTYDELFNDYLVKFQNQFPSEDSSVGRQLYRWASTIAGIAYGLYKKMGFVERQYSLLLMTDANFLREMSTYGLAPAANETPGDFRTRGLAFVRQRPAGGTKLDHQRETVAVDGADVAKVLGPEDGQTPGNVAAVILSGPTTGAADATEALKLHDADGGFVAGMVGATITNTDDDTEAEITAFVDSGELTLDTDIFVSGKK